MLWVFKPVLSLFVWTRSTAFGFEKLVILLYFNS